MLEYYRTRSSFWLRIHDDNDYANISTDAMGVKLLERVSPEITSCSPTGWKKSSVYKNLYTLWIPNSRMDWDALADVKLWAERANRHIWLGPNQNTKRYFKGDEIDYCLAADWNFDMESRTRTPLGAAEYQLKYKERFLSADDSKIYADLLLTEILDCIDCLSLPLSNYVIMPVPAVAEKQNKLAWRLAKQIACEKQLLFVNVTLLHDKPQMKEQSFDDKIKIWREIFGNHMLDFSPEFYGSNVIIIDDLYQSGASIWCFAEYLKHIYHVEEIVAITPVKAMKDGGNK